MALTLSNQVKFKGANTRSPSLSSTLNTGNQLRMKSSGDVLGSAMQHQSKVKFPEVENPDKGVDRTANSAKSGNNPFKYTK